MRATWLLVLALGSAFLATAHAQDPAGLSVEIDLQEQTAYLIENGQVVLRTPISTGRAGHQTNRGTFKIIEKERNHHSTLYGKIVDSRGNTITADADSDMPVPRGARFEPAPMRYFMRFNGAEGMHAGYLPGYAASHGCVRMPEANAIALFNAVEVGTPVTVFGTTTLRGNARQDDGYSTRRRSMPQRQVRRDWQLDERLFQPRWR